MNQSLKIHKAGFASILLAVFIAFIMMWKLTDASSERPVNQSYELIKGLEYLDSADQFSADTANAFYRERQRAKAEAAKSAEERARLIRELKNDEIDVFSVFRDYVILGDSRAYGFSHYELLDHHRVLAGGGHTIIYVREYMEEIKRIDPSYIYLCYGVNDAGISLWKTDEAYAEEVTAVINELKKEMPDAKIILSSIIWISEDAYNRFPKWGRIYQFNPAYKKICEETGIIFADNDKICENLKPQRMWATDGIHLSKSFYQLWAKNLLLAAMEDGQS